MGTVIPRRKADSIMGITVKYVSSLFRFFLGKIYYKFL